MVQALDKLAALRRELAHRRWVYPQLVEKGKMNPHDANRQITIIEAIIKDYEQCWV